MAKSNQPTPILLGNMVNNINRSSFVGLEERDNLIHALLNDCAFFINQSEAIKTAVRTYDDEFFNLQLFNELENYQLLITYFPLTTSFDVNKCNSKELVLSYEVYYKMEAKEDNKNKLKEIATLLNLLICLNYNNSLQWSYTDTKFNKVYQTITSNNFSNKLISEEPLFSKIESTNFLFLKQVFELKFTYSKAV